MWKSSTPQPFTGTNKDRYHLNSNEDLESQQPPPPRRVTFKGSTTHTSTETDHRSRADEENGDVPSTADEERRGSGVDSVELKEHVSGCKSENVTWKDRLQLFTWNWFTMVMATGGIANAINSSKSKLPENNDERKDKRRKKDGENTPFPLTSLLIYREVVLSL